MKGGMKMENVTVTETRGGNPKYILNNSYAEVRVELRKKDNTAQIHLKHSEIDASNIYGREISVGNNEIYLKSLPKTAYPYFCEALINQINESYAEGKSMQDIAFKLYNTYQNNENVKNEVYDLQEKFKKLNAEYKENLSQITKKLEELNEISKEMDYMCKLMEML